MQRIEELLERATQAIETGESSLKAAAKDIAAAAELGATQRRIAEAVGKSCAWVNRLLKWRENGYAEATPFGLEAKAKRERARVQAPERTNHKRATTSEQARAAAERARAESAKAEAAKAAAEARKAKADARKARADAERAKAEARTTEAKEREEGRRASYDFGGSCQNRIQNSRDRDRLVKALGMLGSAHEGERANAAAVVEKQRRKLGMTWDELVVQADEALPQAA